MQTETQTANRLFVPLIPTVGEGSTDSTDIRARLYDAEAAARDAEQRWRDAVLSAGPDGDRAAVQAIERELLEGRSEINRLEAILLEMDGREAEAARAARKATEDAEDAAQIKAYRETAKAARKVAKAAEVYAKALQTLSDAEDQARALASVNPRTRHDLLTRQPLKHLIGVELARLSAGQTFQPPGADAWSGMRGDPAHLPTLAGHFDNLVMSFEAHFAPAGGSHV